MNVNTTQTKKYAEQKIRSKNVSNPKGGMNFKHSLINPRQTTKSSTKITKIIVDNFHRNSSGNIAEVAMRLGPIGKAPGFNTMCSENEEVPLWGSSVWPSRHRGDHRTCFSFVRPRASPLLITQDRAHWYIIVPFLHCQGARRKVGTLAN